MTKFGFVSAERANHAVAALCRGVGAGVSGFHAWLRAIPAVRHRAEAEAELRGRIGRICAVSRHHFNLRNAISTAYSRTWMRSRGGS